MVVGGVTVAVELVLVDTDDDGDDTSPEDIVEKYVGRNVDSTLVDVDDSILVDVDDCFVDALSDTRDEGLATVDIDVDTDGPVGDAVDDEWATKVDDDSVVDAFSEVSDAGLATVDKTVDTCGPVGVAVDDDWATEVTLAVVELVTV